MTAIATAVPAARPGVRAAVRRHPLATFGVLAYAISWAWWLPIALSGDEVTAGRAWPTHFPGLLGPAVAAVATTAMLDGWAGVRELGRRVGRWRIGLTGWLLALGTPLAMLVAAAPFDRDLSWSSLGSFNGLGAVGPIGVLAALVLVNGIGEETGWRGFAYDHLRARHDRRAASLRVALLWGLWHLPLFLILESFRGFSVGTLFGFGFGLACGALVLGWIYERTGASILAIAVWHGTYNLAAAAGDAPVRSAIVTALVMAWAMVLARRLPSVDTA